MGNTAGDVGTWGGVFAVTLMQTVLRAAVFVNVNINTSFVREILCHTSVQFGNGTQGLRILLS